MEKDQNMAHMLSHDEINKMPGREMKEKRTQEGKMFDLGGGHYQGIVAMGPVHARNTKGKWEDIDHSLIRRGNTLESFSPDLNVCFAPGGSVTLTKGGYSLSWTVANAQPTLAIEEKAKECIQSDFPRKAETQALESTVQYLDLMPGVDLKAQVMPGRFKDTLTFKTVQAVQPIEFYLHAPGLNLIQQENGDVLVVDKDQTVFRLTAPFAVDEEGNAIPDSALVSLKEMEDELWSWTVALDSNFAAKASYPVHLDPVVETEQTTSAMSMAYVTSKHSSTNYQANGYSANIACNDFSWGKCNVFLRFDDNSLPKIDSSYYVTNAILTLKSTDNNANMRIYAKEVLGNWSDSTITYSNAPAVESHPFEYQSAHNTVGVDIDFNITNLVRKWYAGNNHGIMLECLEDGLIQIGAAGAVYYKPYVTIDYISLAGLEGYLSQDSHSCGRAGTAYVGMFNGNLVVAHQDTSMNGNLMPFSLTRYYNSCYHDVNPFDAGYGWKFSSQKTLHRETIGSVLYYVYMDGDGTRHHFKQTSGVWNDLSGLSLKLTISGTNATITDKRDNALTFDLPTDEFNNNYANVKMIKSITDATGNTISFVHNSNHLTTAIQDGAGRTTTLTKYSITAPDMNSLTTIFSNSQPGMIYHEDGKTTQYTYDASTNLLTKMKNIDGSAIKFFYTAQEPYRITKVVYLDNNSVEYGGRQYTYGDCKTTVTELYPDTNGTLTQGKSLVYHFNDAGNVISVNDELGYGCFSGYSSDLPLNHPEYVSKMQRVVSNYLLNHRFQTINTDWSFSNLNGGTGSGAYNSEQVYIGGRSYRLSKTNVQGQSAVYQTVIFLYKAHTYTFSCYFKTSNAAAVQLRVQYMDSTNTTVVKESAAFTSTDKWDRVSMPFTIPGDPDSYGYATVYIMAVNGIGDVWVDATQVEEGPVANRYNLLENAMFNWNTTSGLTYWTAGNENTSLDTVYLPVAAISGRPSSLNGNILRIYGTAGANKYFQQKFSCIGNAGDTFVAGGWSANYTRPRSNASSPCEYEMQVIATYHYSNNTTSEQVVGSVKWSEEWSGWHFAAVPVVMQQNYSEIGVKIIYRNSLNYAEFSNLFLHKEEFGNSFTYDSSGNVTSVKNLASLQSYATYDSFNNLLTYRQPGRPYNVQYTQTWGDTDAEKKKHLLRTIKTPASRFQEYTYDVKGNPLTVKTRNSNNSLVISSSVTYSANDNYVATHTDARGKTTTFDCDPNKGNVISVTNPNGQTAYNIYDNLNRKTSTYTIANAKVYRKQNTYTNDLLTKVAHNTESDSVYDVEYNFEYDSQNRPTKIKVGNQILSENVYNTTLGDPLYGTLKQVKYGNQQTEEYVYDEFKRLVGVRLNGSSTDSYQYDYGAEGRVRKMTDYELDRTEFNEYDVQSRPMRITTTEGDDHIYTGQVIYDEYNNLKTFKEKVGVNKAAFQTDFTYDYENRPTVMSFGDNNNKVNYVYDGVNRVSTRTVTVAGLARPANYTYVVGSHNGSNTTPLVASISQLWENFTYTYDNLGNIKTVTQNGKLTTYTYDDMSQLIRVDDENDTTSGNSGTSWTYEYDRGGNILNKKRYAYTTGSLGSPLQTIPYFYGDSNWKDKLTAFNYSAVTYDGMGNPINYNSWTYTWARGRQLVNMSNGYETVSYKYNADGLRIEKRASTVIDAVKITKYTLHGKIIMHLTQGDDSMHFFYDAQSRPAIVEWNNGTATTKYAYIYNLQGDVIALIDNNGAEVVKYVYDAWGKVLSTTGTLASTLGTIQPFRYRGYVYDVETGLYYLRSRYYDPDWGRFINADSVLIGHSFSYCSNSPISAIDETGHMPTTFEEKALRMADGTYATSIFAAQEIYETETGKQLPTEFYFDGELLRDPDRITYQTIVKTHIEKPVESILWKVADYANMLYDDITAMVTTFAGPTAGFITLSVTSLGSYFYMENNNPPETHQYTEHRITYSWNEPIDSQGKIFDFSAVQTFYTSSEPSCNHFDGLHLSYEYTVVHNFRKRRILTEIK